MKQNSSPQLPKKGLSYLELIEGYLCEINYWNGKYLLEVCNSIKLKHVIKSRVGVINIKLIRTTCNETIIIKF